MTKNEHFGSIPLKAALANWIKIMVLITIKAEPK